MSRVLETLYLIKLKIKSPFNIIVLILFCFAIVYTLLSINHPFKSSYSEGKGEIKGIVTNCQKTDNGVKITLKTKENILVNYYKDYKCILGKEIKAYGEYKLPSENTIFNLFNYQNYLRSLKIYMTFTANEIKATNHKTSLNYKIKNNLIDKISPYKSHEYLSAFILGDSKEINKEVLNSYRNNGISHLLAISGMHITLLSGVILFLLNLIFKKPKLNYFIVIIILFFYAFLTNFTPSVIRATLLFIILSIKKVFDLKIDTLFILILIATLYLFYNPFIIYHIGFLFSFTITFYLILFSTFLGKFKSYINKTFIVSFIAFIAGIPILINNFFNINLLSPILNIIFVPLVSLVIYPLSLIALLIGSLDNLLYTVTSIMEKMSLFFNEINIFNITLKHINVVFIIIYYFVITYTIYSLDKGRKKGLFILILFIIIHNNINYLEKNPTLTMIDVGQGDSFLLKLPHNQGNILIDTGGLVTFNDKPTYDLIMSKTIPYLKSEGIKQIDYLILTHGDFDHAGMAPNLINNFKIKNILLNSSTDNSLEKTIMDLADKKDINYSKVNEKLLKIKNYTFNFLGSQKSSNENDDSLIIYTKINGVNILLMGDASEQREKYILNTYKMGKVDILKVGHHGSKSSTSPKLIEEIRPDISLISAGKNNLYGHPHKETIRRLEHSKVLITLIDGSVKLILNKRIIYTTAR